MRNSPERQSLGRLGKLALANFPIRLTEASLRFHLPAIFVAFHKGEASVSCCVSACRPRAAAASVPRLLNSESAVSEAMARAFKGRATRLVRTALVCK